MSIQERLARGVKATFAANVIGALSNAALVILFTRVLLTPEGYGRLNFALSMFGVLAIFATLGLPKSAARYVTEYLETDTAQLRHIIRRSLAYIAVVTFVVSGAIFLFGRSAAQAVGESSLVPFLLVGAVYVGVRSFEKYLSAIFQGLNRVTWSAVLSTVSGVGRLVFASAFVLLGFGVVGAMWGYVTGFVVSVALGSVVLYSRFYTGFPPSDSPETGLSRRLVEYSVPLTATRGANVLDKKVDTVLVGILLNMTAVGYYTIAKQISDVVSMPAASFGFTISPTIGEQKASDRLDRAARLYEESLKYVLLLYVPAVTGLVLVASPLVRYVFGTPYLGAVPVVQLFAGFILVNAVNKVTSDGLDYLGRARARAVVKSLMAGSNFALNLVFIPAFGVAGAALATVITYTVYTLTNVYVIHQELGLDLDSILRQLVGICLVTAAMAAAVVLARPYVANVVSLFVVIGVGVGVWAALSVLVGLLDVRRVAQLLG